MQKHIETFLALCRDDWEDERISPPAERELRRELECGILAYGCTCAGCEECGHDFLVASLTEKAPVPPILNPIGEPSMPPRIAPARGPPPWEGNESGALFLDEERFPGDPLNPPRNGSTNSLTP